MNTPTHFLLHACIRKFFKDKRQFNIPRSFLLGSIAPDILLFVLVFSYIPLSIYIFWNTTEYTFRHMFDTLYFEHPLWIFSYNILHAPLSLAILFIILFMSKNFIKKFYRVGLWFLAWCALHSIFDIPLHHDDGPRIFYPFSDYSFSSPISYWDVNHYGAIVWSIELLCIVIFLYYLFHKKIRSSFFMRNES